MAGAVATGTGEPTPSGGAEGGDAGSVSPEGAGGRGAEAFSTVVVGEHIAEHGSSTEAATDDAGSPHPIAPDDAGPALQKLFPDTDDAGTPSLCGTAVDDLVVVDVALGDGALHAAAEGGIALTAEWDSTLAEGGFRGWSCGPALSSIHRIATHRHAAWLLAATTDGQAYLRALDPTQDWREIVLPQSDEILEDVAVAAAPDGETQLFVNLAGTVHRTSLGASLPSSPDEWAHVGVVGKRRIDALFTPGELGRPEYWLLGISNGIPRVSVGSSVDADGNPVELGFEPFVELGTSAPVLNSLAGIAVPGRTLAFTGITPVGDEARLDAELAHGSHAWASVGATSQDLVEIAGGVIAGDGVRLWAGVTRQGRILHALAGRSWTPSIP